MVVVSIGTSTPLTCGLDRVSLEGSDNSNACNCSIGFYGGNDASGECQPCNNGYYCPIPTQQLPCPSSYYCPPGNGPDFCFHKSLTMR
jgi:hypothetical protein